MNDNSKLMGCIGWVSVIVLSVVLGIPLSGWVLSVMWGWFVVPVFHLPDLTVWQAVGLSCIVAFLKSSSNNDNKTKTEVEIISNLLVAAFFSPLLALGFAWIVHSLMR